MKRFFFHFRTCLQEDAANNDSDTDTDADADADADADDDDATDADVEHQTNFQPLSLQVTEF